MMNKYELIIRVRTVAGNGDDVFLHTRSAPVPH